MGQTSRCLQDRIHQHVPKSIQNRTDQEQKQAECQGKSANAKPHGDSLIGNHLLCNQKCVPHYKYNQFSIRSKARSDFHFSISELIFITLCEPKIM